MVEPTLITELERDVSELFSLASQAQRPHVKLFLDKEVARIQDLILIVFTIFSWSYVFVQEKNKVVQKTEENKVNEPSQDTTEYIAIKNYSWEQEGKTVKLKFKTMTKFHGFYSYEESIWPWTESAIFPGNRFCVTSRNSALISK